MIKKIKNKDLNSTSIFQTQNISDIKACPCGQEKNDINTMFGLVENKGKGKERKERKGA